MSKPINELKKGIIYTSIGTYSGFILQLIISMILSRLLTPQEYGVVAIVQVFILFFMIMVESGMGPAIIQNKKLTDSDYRILFNFSGIFAFVVAILFGFFGLVLSLIYKNPIYQYLTWVQAISVLFNGLNVVPTAVLNKEKRFKEVNASTLIANFAGGLIGVLVALLGGGVYALILSSIISSGVNFFINRAITRLFFIRKLNLSALRKILKFSINQFGANFLAYFSRNSDNILIGRFMGPAILANYNKAYSLLMLPFNFSINIIGVVLQPVLSEYQDNVDFIRSFFLKMVHILALVGIPLSIFFSLSAKQIILFMYGPQWSDAIMPFSILSLTIWIQMVISVNGAILQSRNHSKIYLITQILYATIIITSIIIGILWGDIVKVSICLTIGFTINFFVCFYRTLKYSLYGKISDFLKEFFSPFILGGIVLLALKPFNYIDFQNNTVSILLRVLVFILIFILYIFVTPEKKRIAQMLKK